MRDLGRAFEHDGLLPHRRRTARDSPLMSKGIRSQDRARSKLIGRGCNVFALAGLHYQSHGSCLTVKVDRAWRIGNFRRRALPRQFVLGLTPRRLARRVLHLEPVG
jgi:hypothetical protein